MSKEIAFANGWDAHAARLSRDDNPHPACDGNDLLAAKFSRSMRDEWWFGFDTAAKGQPNDYTAAYVTLELQASIR